MRKIKSLAEAFSIFKENAIKHGISTLSGDYKLGNKCYKNIISAINTIASNDGYEILRPLLNEANPSVRLWAAYALLHVDKKKAIETLKKIIKTEDGMIAFTAEMTLEEFKRGSI